MTIIVITTLEYNKKTCKKELIASHGVDIDTGKNVILSQDHPSLLGAKFSDAYGEWIIEDH